MTHNMAHKEKRLKDEDIILSLKRIVISQSDSRSSCPVHFDFECSSKAGYVEDPSMAGEIKVLSVKKEKGCYFLKIKFKRDKDLDW